MIGIENWLPSFDIGERHEATIAFSWALGSGTRLGAYELPTPIGSGGIGEAYSAKATRSGRDVAIKIAERLFGQRMRKRFLDFTFERESHWMVVLYVLLPPLAIFLLVVIPGRNLASTVSMRASADTMTAVTCLANSCKFIAHDPPRSTTIYRCAGRWDTKKHGQTRSAGMR